MGFFGDSTQEREVKALIHEAHDIMQKLIQDYRKNEEVTFSGKSYIFRMGDTVNKLFEKSSNMSTSKNMTLQVVVDGQPLSLMAAKMAFIHFIRDFERMTGENFSLKYS
ncbi:hypothetical protein M2132_002340 [Dysgonomonas sp. PH5-45]|uniref:hypothetical protein n=1 Tax=unclassified Dysgonomonas TaxID=2630389 RepID=UPI0024734325|nr:MULTISPECIES: hypothetical protein [unclassified Dysgonomonas]MDH6355989.1 hypothetical protein [Dysgonomonas sp. PH5-45]MDH6388884.1 hypothetical protein [Dysgonomonas sp. PH5-37]